MEIFIINTEEGLKSIEAEWRNLELAAGQPSLFCSYDYTHLAWNCFHSPEERLLILTLRKGGELTAVAPFRVSTHSRRGIQSREVDWIATWEGERPDLLCKGDAATCWRPIERFLAKEFRGWDVLRLTERLTPIDPRGELSRTSWVDTTEDAVGYYIELSGSFDDYMCRIDTKVRSNWRNRHRRIYATFPTAHLEKLTQPELMDQAVERFIALEQATWKAGTLVGMGKDERHRNFYKRLTSQLAPRGDATFYFLTTGDRDIAASLLLAHRDVIYERHIAHDPEFSSMSPGIILRTELMKGLFDSKWRILDLMGMHPSIGRQRHKADWATGHWRSVAQHCYRRLGRMTPIVIARKVRRFLSNSTPLEDTTKSTLGAE